MNISATYNHTVDGTDQWNVARLASSSFHEENPDISLKERGVGFWSWKPFIIEHALKNAKDGDLVFYSDVGRMNVLLLRTGLDPFVEWMDATGQDCIPGVAAPWYGPLSKWVRRDTMEYFGFDTPEFYRLPQMQASFSLWRRTPETLRFVKEWKEHCFSRPLVSDDPNPSGRENAPDFVSQYGDQTILSLLTLKYGMKGMVWDGENTPPFMQKSPEDWLIHSGGTITNSTVNGILFQSAKIYLYTEGLFRKTDVR